MNSDRKQRPPGPNRGRRSVNQWDLERERKIQSSRRLQLAFVILCLVLAVIAAVVFLRH